MISATHSLYRVASWLRLISDYVDFELSVYTRVGVFQCT